MTIPDAAESAPYLCRYGGRTFIVVSDRPLTFMENLLGFGPGANITVTPLVFDDKVILDVSAILPESTAVIELVPHSTIKNAVAVIPGRHEPQ